MQAGRITLLVLLFSIGLHGEAPLCSKVFGSAAGTLPGGQIRMDGDLYGTDSGLLYTGDLGGNNLGGGCDGGACIEGGASDALTFPPNDSTIDGSGSLSVTAGNDYRYRTYGGFNGGDTITVAGTGTAAIHIRQNGMSINGKINETGDASQLVMYIRGDVTVNGSGVVHAILYVDGDVIINGSVTGAVTATGQIRLNGSGSIRYSPQAVADTDFRGVCSADTGPALHYTFGDCTVGQPVTTFTDVSGNGNDATAYNGPLCVDTGSGRRGVRFNSVADGSAYELHQQYAKTNANFSFTYEEGYTVFARLRFNWSPARIWALFFGVTGGDTCANNGAHWLINTQDSGDCGHLGKGVAQFGVFCGAQNRFDLSGAAGTDLALATVYYNNSNRLVSYINGVKVSETVSESDPDSGNAPVYMARPWSNCSEDAYFSGVMDELRIYPRALGEAEILGLFSSPVNAADLNPPTFANRRIGTKVAGQPFPLWVGGLNSSRDALQPFTKSMLRARVVPSASCPAGDTALSGWSGELDLETGSNPAEVLFQVDRASRDARIQFEWTDDGVTMRECSFDNFSVRPAAVTAEVLDTAALQAGVTYGDRLRLSGVDGYDQNLSRIDIEVLPLTRSGEYGGEEGSLGLAPFTFAGATPLFADINYSEAGRIEVRLRDGDWSGVDGAKGECTAQSCSNQADDTALFGCDTCGSPDYNLTFVPYRFDMAFLDTPLLEDNSTFTYFSNERNMSARVTALSLAVRALNRQGGTTRNYTDRTAGGYEQDIRVRIDVNISAADKSRIGEYGDAAFTEGEAVLTLPDWLYNPGRQKQMPQNPLRLPGDDVNLSVSLTDSDGVLGTLFQNGVEGNATFLYGRINPIDGHCTAGEVCDVSCYFEIYCRGCVQEAFGLTGWPESVNDVFWLINPDHPGSQPVLESTPAFDATAYDDNGRQTLLYSTDSAGRKRVVVDHAAGQAPGYLLYEPYSDRNVTGFYLDIGTPSAGEEGMTDVVENEGEAYRGSGRIGE